MFSTFFGQLNKPTSHHNQSRQWLSGFTTHSHCTSLINSPCWNFGTNHIWQVRHFILFRCQKWEKTKMKKNTTKFEWNNNQCWPLYHSRSYVFLIHNKCSLPCFSFQFLLSKNKFLAFVDLCNFVVPCYSSNMFPKLCSFWFDTKWGWLCLKYDVCFEFELISTYSLVLLARVALRCSELVFLIWNASTNNFIRIF